MYLNKYNNIYLMNYLDINYDLYNIIIKSNICKNFVLRLYMINNIEFIDRSNINELIELFNTHKYNINIRNIHFIKENIMFNNQSHILINKDKLIELIKKQNNKILYNTVILLLEDIRKVKLYPTHNNDIKKIKNEIDKLKIELNELQKIKREFDDFKLTIRYLNNKINKINNSKIDINNIENTNMNYNFNFSGINKIYTE